MNKIEWKKEYELGVEEIDNQHKKLVDIVNRYVEAKTNNHEEKIIGPIVKELVEYTQTHFSSEEMHMQQHNYPLLLLHKSQHKALVAQLINILKDMKERKSAVGDELLQLLKAWLIKHILEEDHKYAKYLNKIR